MALELYKDEVRKIVHIANKKTKKYNFREKDVFVCPSCQLKVANKMRSIILRELDKL